jgi:hypothetical protein
VVVRWAENKDAFNPGKAMRSVYGQAASTPATLAPSCSRERALRVVCHAVRSSGGYATHTCWGRCDGTRRRQSGPANRRTPRA